MKRAPRFKTETCPTCHKPGWTRQLHNSLISQDEWNYGETKVEGLPSGFEPLRVSSGASIYEACNEAIEYCREAGVPGVGFEFNGLLVLATSKSNGNDLARDWWQRRYHETPEESFAKR